MNFLHRHIYRLHVGVKICLDIYYRGLASWQPTCTLSVKGLLIFTYNLVHYTTLAICDTSFNDLDVVTQVAKFAALYNLHHRSKSLNYVS